MAFTTIWILAIIAIAIYSVKSIIEKRKHAQKARELGCEPVVKWPRNRRDLLQADKDKTVLRMMQERVKKISAREGRYVETFQMNRVTTSDPKNIQALLATQFKDFELGPLRKDSFFPLLGVGIFTADGEVWSHSRALLRPQFTREQVSDLDLEECHVRNAMRAITINGSDGWTTETDLQSIFFRLTMDSATEFLFGKSVNSQLAALSSDTDTSRKEEDFSYHFNKAQWYLVQRNRLGNYHWLLNNKEFRTSCKAVHAFVDQCIDSSLKAAVHEKPSSNYIFLHALTDACKDPVEIRSQLLNILIAGRDTTASLLSWVILMLARHPRVFNHLRQTILDEFGSYENPRNITFSSLKSCQYLQYCLNETLRLFPVVPVNRRQATRDTTLPRGGGNDGLSTIYIRNGQAVVYNTHILHRREDIWGPDAEEFKPERWLNRKVGWEYVPFNGGPRICIGQQFALTEAGYVLVRLLQRFDVIEDVYPERDIRWGLTLTSCPAENVTVRMHQAKSG